MKFELGNYLIESNDLCYTVKIKRVKAASEKTKEENVGEEYHQNLGYYTTLENAIKHIPEHIVKTSKDLNEVLEKLAEIDTHIEMLRGGILMETTYEIEINEDCEREFKSIEVIGESENE